MKRRILRMVQGKVIEISPASDPTVAGFATVKLMGIKGSTGSYLFHEHDAREFETGDVIRAILDDLVPEHLKSQPPLLYRVANLGKVKVNSKRRSHYKFGETLRGKVLEHTGSEFVLDDTVHFAKVRLRDGTITEVSFERNLPSPGTKFRATVGHSMFDKDRNIFPFGFGNLGGMPSIHNIRRDDFMSWYREAPRFLK